MLIWLANCSGCVCACALTCYLLIEAGCVLIMCEMFLKLLNHMLISGAN